MMIILKAIVIQATFLAVYHTLLKCHKSFTFNRFFLLFGLLSLLSFSWIEIVIPHYVTVQHSELLAPLDHELTAILSQPSYNYEHLILLILLGCSVLIFCTRSRQLFSLATDRLGYSSKGYEVRELPALRSPFSFWPRIYMTSQDFHNPECALIIRHEEIHLSRLHTLDILIGEVIAALLWFSPLSWLYLRAIKNNHEYEVDQHFAGDAAELSEYLQLLYKSWSLTGPIMASRFDFTTNKNRIVMLTSERAKMSRFAQCIVIILASVPLVFMACTEKTVFIPEEQEMTDELAELNFKEAVLDTLLEFRLPTELEWENASKNIKVRGGTWKDVRYFLNTYGRDSVPAPSRPPAPPDASKLLPPPPPPPPPPLPVRQPTSELIDSWINGEETYDIWLDGNRILNSDIPDLMKDKDIYHFSVMRQSDRDENVTDHKNIVKLMSKDAFDDYNTSFYLKEKEFLKQLDEWRQQYDQDYLESIKESLEQDNYEVLLRPEELIKALNISDNDN